MKGGGEGREGEFWLNLRVLSACPITAGLIEIDRAVTETKREEKRSNHFPCG